MADPVTGKRALRERLLSRRRSMQPNELAQAASALCETVLALPEVAHARTVAAYVSVGSEPGTGPLLEAWEAAGVQTLLPLLREDGDLDWARYTGPHGLAPAARGMLQPQARPLGRDAVRAAAVLVVPALAVDRRGYRLGRGGGSYDRVLARIAGSPTFTLALLHQGELLDLPVPTEPHDRPVDAAALPGRVVHLR